MSKEDIVKLKDAIAKRMHCDINCIKLFGSRITGNFTEESDLDIAILDEEKEGNEHKTILGFNCDIHYVSDLNVSWLKNSI